MKPTPAHPQSWTRRLIFAVWLLASTHAFPSAPPRVSLQATDPWASENWPDFGRFTVFRTGPTNFELRVAYRVEGTASNGVDYPRLRGEVNIPVGARAADLLIKPYDDREAEGTETVVVWLEAPPTNAPMSYVLGWPSAAVVEIEDNDPLPTNAPPRIEIASPSGSPVLTEPPKVTIVAYSDDEDSIRAVEFYDGTNRLGVMVNRRLPGLDGEGPTRGEGDMDSPYACGIPPLEQPGSGGGQCDGVWSDHRIAGRPRGSAAVARVTWRNPSPGEHVLTAVARDSAGAAGTSAPVHLSIAAASAPPEVITKASEPKAFESCRPPPIGGCEAVFTVKRLGPTDEPLTVFLDWSGTATYGVDYAKMPTVVTLEAGVSSTDLVVSPINDEEVEDYAESIILSLAPSPLAGTGAADYRPGPCAQATAYLYDDDGDRLPNEPPVVWLTQPFDGQIFHAPADIELAAAAVDVDDDVRQVEFFACARSLGVVTNDPTGTGLYRLRWTNVMEGHYVLTAEATDTRGLKARSRPVEIDVVLDDAQYRALPVVSIEATDPEAAEVSPLLGAPPNPAHFTVTRTGPTNAPLTVFYRVGGTASNGADYARLPGELTIPGGAATAELLVDVMDDALCEGDETVIVTLGPVQGDWPSIIEHTFRLATNHQAKAAIHDDNDCEDHRAPLLVELVQPRDGDVFVAPANIECTALVTDPEANFVTVRFDAGLLPVGEVTKFSQWGFFEEPFTLVWSNVPAGGYSLSVTATDDLGQNASAGPVRVRVEAPTPLVWLETADALAAETPPTQIPDTATFTLRRNCCTNEAWTVRVEFSGTASNGVDYVYLTNRWTLEVGEWSKDIVIEPIDDELVEGTESATATLLPAEGALHPLYLPVLDQINRPIALILDNDFNRSPRAEVVSPANGSAFPSNATVRFAVTASDSDGRVRAVDLMVDGIVIGSASMPIPGEGYWDAFWTNPPPGQHKAYAIVVDNVGAASISKPVNIVVFDPCDRPTVTIVATDPFGAETSPLGPPDTATFTVTRHCVGNVTSDRDLVVRYTISGTASNSVDYELSGFSGQATTGEVLIPQGTNSAQVVVSPIDDDFIEGIETITLRLLDPGCDDPSTFVNCYVVGEPGAVTAYLLDNEVPMDLTALTNQPATFTVGGDGGDLPLRFQWRHDGINLTNDGRITGAQSPTLTISSVVLSDAGKYDAVVSLLDPLGPQTISKAAELTVLEPPVITQQPASVVVLAGQTATYTVTVTDAASVAYQWRRNGAPLVDGGRISGANRSRLVIHSIAPADEGLYDVMIARPGHVEIFVISQPTSLTVLQELRLTIARIAQGVVVFWDATDVILQESDAATGPWRDLSVPTAQTRYVVTAPEPVKFYRLRTP